MPEENCEQCRKLLKAVSDALIANIEAIAALTEAVQYDPAESSDPIGWVRETSDARELAVERYEEHRVSHQLLVMAAECEVPTQVNSSASSSASSSAL